MSLGSAFDILGFRVRRAGAIRDTGILRAFSQSGAFACQACGPLATDAVSWENLTDDAIRHFRDTGHAVAIERNLGAVYGPAPRTGGMPEHRPETTGGTP